MVRLLVLLIGLTLLGCGGPTDETPATDPNATPEAGAAPDAAVAPPPPAPAEDDAASPSPSLDDVLAAQPEEVQARYPHRHPKETLEFFGIEPGMTVVEVLPGSGWYSRILVTYLGPEGRLIGANYPRDVWPALGMTNPEQLDAMARWVQEWPAEARQWQGENGARIEAFELGALPAGLEGQADAVLVIRALHNLARVESEGGYLGTSVDDLVRVLKPGGILGVVQHEARPDMPDAWASGAAGYLKKQFVIDRLTEAGLELVEESDINQNPKDRPTIEDVVWRLPPSYGTSGDDPQKRAEVDAIGESNRMTLKFRKPV
ncbi:MAG TPA: hypothetical protein VF210_00195 [Pseudomonadales bacterium]